MRRLGQINSAAFISWPTDLTVIMLRRGGNITGLWNFTPFPVLTSRQLELIKQLIRNARRVIVLVDRDDPPNALAMSLVKKMPGFVGVDLRFLEVGKPDTWPALFASIAAFQPDALLQWPSANCASAPEELVDIVGVHRLPAIYAEREFADAGGLMSYGIDLSEQWRHLAGYVHKILKGASPGELWVEGPTKYELAINLKTAKALGLDVPPSLLARADEVIE